MKWYHIEFAREHNGEPDYVCGNFDSLESAQLNLQNTIKREIKADAGHDSTERELEDYYHVTRAYVSHTRIWPV